MLNLAAIQFGKPALGAIICLLVMLNLRSMCAIYFSEKLAFIADVTASWASANYAGLSWNHSFHELYVRNATAFPSSGKKKTIVDRDILLQRAQMSANRIAAAIGLSPVKVQLDYDDDDKSAAAKNQVEVVRATVTCRETNPILRFFSLGATEGSATATSVLPDDEPPALVNVVPARNASYGVLVPAFGVGESALKGLPLEVRSRSFYLDTAGNRIQATGAIDGYCDEGMSSSKH